MNTATSKYLENATQLLSSNGVQSSITQHRNSSNGSQPGSNVELKHSLVMSQQPQQYSGGETLHKNHVPGSTSMKGMSNSGTVNYRQSTTASSKDSYHLQLLNKENKALQNLLAAVELNRTTANVVGQVNDGQVGGVLTSKSSNGVMATRATQMGSAKQQQHLQNLLHQQQQQQQQLQAARDHYQSHREFGRDLSNPGAAQQNQQPMQPQIVHPILSTKAAGSTVLNQAVHYQNNGQHPSSGNNISIFKNFISQYQSNTGNGAPVQGISTKNGGGTNNVSQNSAKLELTQSAVLASATNGSGKAQGINARASGPTQYISGSHHLPQPHPPHHYNNHEGGNGEANTNGGAANRASTSQAIKSFDGPAQNAAHQQVTQQANGRTQSSSTYHHAAKAFISNSTTQTVVEPIRRKTTTAASLHQQQRRTGVELVKIGQKLTSENAAQAKGSSFIADEINHHPISQNMQNTQSSANLHTSNAPMAPQISVKPSTTTNMNAQPVLLSRTNLSSAGQPLILPKPSSNAQSTLTPNYLMNSTAAAAHSTALQGYTSSRMNSTNGPSQIGLSNTLHSKLNNNSKSNLHAPPKQQLMHIVIEDKENRRDMVNRQSQQIGGGSGAMPSVSGQQQPQMQQNSSSTSLLKRSKTSDPSRGLQIRVAAQQKENVGKGNAEGLTQQSNLAVANIHLPQLAQTSHLQQPLEAPQQPLMPQLLPQIQPLPEPNHGNDDTTPTTQSDEAMEQPPTLSQAKMEEVARLMEERRKERMKTLTRNLEVCDLLDIRNPQSVAEFAPQIYRYLHSEELNHMYPQDFLVTNQTEITEKMRAYLIDWLSELHLKFKLWPETLYVCTGIIDKFIMLQPDIKKKDLQCLGITALHIAGKYEEIYPPELKQILRVTDNAVSKDEVLALEFKILQTLDFNVTFPSILRFMERYARIAQVQERTQILAQYLCDTCLLDCTLMKERPSKLAAVCLYAAMRLAKGNINSTGALFWNATLTKNTGYKEEEVRGMAMDLIKFVRNVETSSLQSLYKKYSSARFLEAAKLIQQNGNNGVTQQQQAPSEKLLQQQ